MRETLEKPQAVLDDQSELRGLPPEGWERNQRQAHLIGKLRLLWDRRKTLWRAVQYGFVVSLLVALLIPKQYQSTARLMPPDNQSGTLTTLAALSGRLPAGISGLAGDLLGMKNTSALFVGILRSQTLQDRLIHKFDLMSVYWAWRIEDARDTLEDRTMVNEDRKSGIVTITITDKDPQRARDMAQTYVDELNRLVAEVSTSAARREREFIEQRLKVVKQELDAAAIEFSQFASKNTTIDIREQGRAMVEAAATLQGQLIAAQTELQGLRQVYTEGNVRVRSVQARISELQRQLEKLGGIDESSASGKQQAASAEAAGTMYPSIRKLPLLGVTYADLFRKTKVSETVFELLTQQYELAKVQEAKEIATVKVLDSPQVPQRKSYPPRTLLVLMGTLAAFVFAGVWILASDQWNRISPLDPQRAFAAEVTGVLSARFRSRWQKMRRDAK